MRMNIDSISKSADYKYIRTKRLQIPQKRGADLCPIISSITGSYHIQDMKGI